MHSIGTPPTAHELRVLLTVAEAGSVREAALILRLSPHTVETHIDNLRAKSCKRNIAQILLHYIQAGMIPDLGQSDVRTSDRA